MEKWIIDSIGIMGMIMVVIAYLLLQLEQLHPKGLTYNSLNLAGAILLLISLCFHFNLASFIIELFWICASLIGLWKYRRRRVVGRTTS